VDDLDTEQAVTILLHQHGDNAARYAEQWAAALMESGNRRDAQRFAHIAAALQTKSPIQSKSEATSRGRDLPARLRRRPRPPR